MFGIIYTIAMLIVLPVVFISVLWKAAFKTKLEWMLDALTTAVLLVWLFQAGNWSWVGYYFRYLWLVLFIVAFFISVKKVRDLPFIMKYTKNQKSTIGIYALLLVVFGAYNAFVFPSYSVNEEAINLTFPMKQGTYYVGQGGNSVQMNYHHAYESQQYALDVLKLNKLGIRANGLYPKELTKYSIYGDELYSPCNGEVVESRNDLPDLTPPDSNPENPEGNYVALICEQHEATVYIAHMQEGSVAVGEGNEVKTGQLIGKVGNSGNTTEPHLHIHAELDGVGVPIVFDERFLTRNSLVKTGE